MNILIIVLTTADVLIALMLIALVLVQQSKEGGFGSPFGGMGESVFGAHAQSHLSKLTVIFGSLFLLITLTLTVITGRSHGPRSAVEEIAPDQEQATEITAPAVPEIPGGTVEVGEPIPPTPPAPEQALDAVPAEEVVPEVATEEEVSAEPVPAIPTP